MAIIRYDLIGSLAWCDQYRLTMDDLMDRALTGDKDAELLVVNCAAHFYGLSIWDFNGNVRNLIDTVRAIDQEIAA